MSKSYFLRCESLHSLPKFTSTTTRIQVGNGQYVGVLFVISVIMTKQKHRFEIFTLVSEIHENVEISGMAITKMLDVKEQKTLNEIKIHKKQGNIQSDK